MTTTFERLIERLESTARAGRPRLVYPEANEPRTLRAAVWCHQQGLCQATLVGAVDAIDAMAKQLGVTIPSDVSVRHAPIDPLLGEYAARYRNDRKNAPGGREISEKAASRLLSDRPLFYGAMLVRTGEADGMVAGAEATTGAVILAATSLLGFGPDQERASGAFVMVSPNAEFGEDGVMIFADSGAIPDPTPAELATSAQRAAKLLHDITGTTPRVALLSFSTNGSAEHARVDKVRDAGKILAAQAPTLAFDAEVQLDAALVPGVASRKFPDSKIGGRANVLIFPDLNSGNIGYKLAERLGGCNALGPFLMGLPRPVSDLSRGCSLDDVKHVSALVAALATAPQSAL